MNIETMGVIGAGQMGSGIVQVAAANGLKVVMNDISTEFVDKGFATIDNSLSRMVKKEKMSLEEKKSAITCWPVASSQLPVSLARTLMPG